MAICARRSTVSRGSLIVRSAADAKNVAMLQLPGLRMGSRLRYCLRNRGDEVEISVGSVDVRNVMGIRCVGIR